jgi:N-acetylneuraminic acid mutarotase
VGEREKMRRWLESLEGRTLFASAAAVEDIILDNTASSGVTISGSWIASSYDAGFVGSNYLHDSAGGKGSRSVKFAPALAGGTYEVYINYTSSKNRDDAVPVDIVHNGGTTTKFVDERTGGGTWVALGQYDFAAGSAGAVTISNTGTDGYVVADAVRFVTVSTEPPVSEEITLDNNAAGGVTITGTWTASSFDTGFVGSNYLHDGNSSKGNRSVRYTPTLAGGTYEVFINYTSANNRAANVPVDIIHSAGTTTRTIDQRTGGGQWVSLGSFTFNVGTTGSVLIRTNGTSGFVVADAVKFVSSTPPTSVPAAPTNLSAVTVSASEIKLTWTDNANNESAYEVERKTGSGVFARVVTLPAGSTTYSDKGLSPSTTYVYRVRATNALGPSGYSGEDSATTSPKSEHFTSIAWTKAADGLSNHLEAQTAVIDAKLYIFGGFSGGPSKKVETYDPVANKWARLADMPEAITHAGVAVVGRNIYLVGGYTGTDPVTFASKHVWRYNVDSKVWTAMPQFAVGRAAGHVAYFDGYLHFAGGHTSGFTPTGDHYRLKLDGGASWEKLNDKIPFAIGGQRGNEEDDIVIYPYVYSWAPGDANWRTEPSLPLGVTHCEASTAVYDGRIIIMGGEDGFNTGVKNVWALEPGASSWTALSNLPVERWGGNGGVIGDMFIYHGGGNRPSPGTSKTTYIGRPVYD